MQIQKFVLGGGRSGGLGVVNPMECRGQSLR